MTPTINPKTKFTFIEVEQIYDFIQSNGTDEMDEYEVRGIVDMVMGEENMQTYTRDWVNEQLNDGPDLDDVEYLQWMENFYDAHPFLDNIIVCDVYEINSLAGDEYYRLINTEEY